MKTVEAGVIGVGWIGGLRADTLSRTALVDRLHLCDIKPDRLAEVTKLYQPARATLDYFRCAGTRPYASRRIMRQPPIPRAKAAYPAMRASPTQALKDGVAPLPRCVLTLVMALPIVIGSNLLMA